MRIILKSTYACLFLELFGYIFAAVPLAAVNTKISVIHMPNEKKTIGQEKRRKGSHGPPPAYYDSSGKLVYKKPSPHSLKGKKQANSIQSPQNSTTNKAQL